METACPAAAGIQVSSILADPEPVPRKRGRPPKSKQEPNENASSPPKRGRGRPPKIKPSNEFNEEPVQVKRKRGRPPKAKAATQMTSEAMAPQAAQQSDGAQTPIIEPKKRGRPPKPKNRGRPPKPKDGSVQVSSDMHGCPPKPKDGRVQVSSDVHDCPPEDPPRKRGRPPKPKAPDSEEPKPAARKRGRPPKQKPAEESGPQQRVAAALNLAETAPAGPSGKNVLSVDSSSDVGPEPICDGYRTTKEVDEVLASVGVKNPNNVSFCLKAGILVGHVKLLPPLEDQDKKFDLNQVLLKSACPVCSNMQVCVLRKVLFQQDWGGDYETGASGARFKCKCGTNLYVGGICTGEPMFDTGKFHNHCRLCPNFGQCIGDYREAHCRKCKTHYFAGGGGTFSCPCSSQ